MSDFAPCPKCSSSRAQKVGFTWWGGAIGPRLLTHVKCQDCGTTFNGKTGRPNTGAIVVYSAVVGVIVIGLMVLVSQL